MACDNLDKREIKMLNIYWVLIAVFYIIWRMAVAWERFL